MSEGTWEKLAQVAVKGAQYDSRERLPHSQCLEGTRVVLLDYIYKVLDEKSKNQLIWLHGTAGVGKSAVAFTVAERMRGLKVTEETNVEKRLAGTFFFSRKHTDRRTTGRLFATLAYQLASNFPSVRQHVNRAILDNPALLHPDGSLREQIEALFSRPLRQLKSRLRDCPPLTFVIDALDECTESLDQSAPEMLDQPTIEPFNEKKSEVEVAELVILLTQALQDPDLPVTHILVTSRSEAHIHEAMQHEDVRPLVCEIPVRISGQGVAATISLDGADVDEDIYLFLQHSFGKLQSRFSTFPQPTKVQLERLANRAGRRFIVASTMMKFIDDRHNDPYDRLELLLELASDLLPGTEVYKLYDRILSTCADPTQAYLHLSVVAALTDPLPMSQISELLGPGQGRDVERVLMQLRSLIDVPTDNSLPVNIYHSSVRDYVSHRSNCSLPQVKHITSPHSLLALSSLHLIVREIPENTTLLDMLSQLNRQSQAVESHDPQSLEHLSSFMAQPPEPLQVLISLLWLEGHRSSELQFWLETLDGRTWLQTAGGKDWLLTQGGQDWLLSHGGTQWLLTQWGMAWLRQSHGGRVWLRSQGGKGWLQTRDGQVWLRVAGGYGWLQTEDGQDWLQTEDGQDWLQTEDGPTWLKTKGSQDWLQTVTGKEWLRTKRGQGWLQSDDGRVWLQFEGGQGWLQTEDGRVWLQSEGGQGWLQGDDTRVWLQTEGGYGWLLTASGRGWLQFWGGRSWLRTKDGRLWLQSEGGQGWLQTEDGRVWLQTEGGRDWLQTEDGRVWLQTEGGQCWLQTENGRVWLQTKAGQGWLQTEDGRSWLQVGQDRWQTEEGRVWLQTEAGQGWLQTEGAPMWLKTKGGQGWLQTKGGQVWLRTEGGQGWLQTANGQVWPLTEGGQGWLRSEDGQVWLQTEGGQGWLQTTSGRVWLQLGGGQSWLRTEDGRVWLQTEGGQGWLQTTSGGVWLQFGGDRSWLRTEDGRVWLQTEGGQGWLQTTSGKVWLQFGGGRSWLRTEDGRVWLQTEGGQGWLQSDDGRVWLRTEGGQGWLRTKLLTTWLQSRGKRVSSQQHSGSLPPSQLFSPSPSRSLPLLSLSRGKAWLQSWGKRALFQSRSLPPSESQLFSPLGSADLVQTWDDSWLQIHGMKNLQTPEEQDWLQTQAGRYWLQTQAGCYWLQTQAGQGWLQTYAAQKCLQTLGGPGWPQTSSGQCWLLTLHGRCWLQTRSGEDWLRTRDGQDWLQTQCGKDWLQIFGGEDWLQTDGGRDWLQAEGGQRWLQVDGGRKWLQTASGRDWLQMHGGRDWLLTPHGQAWRTTIWGIMAEFSSTLEALKEHIIAPDMLLHPAFQVIQQFKTLPDFLMFPTFLALRHQDHSPEVSPHGHLPPDIEIIHTMKVFLSFAYETREDSRSASDALNYACQNWVVHLSRAPNPWDETLSHIFQSFWCHNLLSWLARQCGLKDLRTCLTILSEGEKIAKQYLQA